MDTTVERPKRGRAVKKMDCPYRGRSVVHTCSNGWTIERVILEEFGMEAFFMGHCLNVTTYRNRTVFSLREPDGTPHVTIVDNVMVGRCNRAPKDKYAALVLEGLPDAVPLEENEYAKEWSATRCPTVQPE